MSESSTKSGAKTRKVELTREAVSDGLEPSLLAAIEGFEPLEFDAGEEAIRWLRDYIENPPPDPWQVILELDQESGRLLGFLVLGYTQFTLSPDDRPVVEMKKKLKAPEQPQAACDVAWIARSAKTKKGFGKDLFTYAVSLALKGGAIAMIVTPHDPTTAEKVWIKRFRFRHPRENDQSPEAPLRLWYPIYKLEGAWPS